MNGYALTPSMNALGLRAPKAIKGIEHELDAGARNLLARVRALTPHRPLTHAQAVRLAERQATVLRRELGFARIPKLATDALEEVPFATVTYRAGFPTSGMATRTDLGWVVVIRGDEAQVRQRFSLAHELKHVVDDPFMHQKTGPLTDGLYPEQQGYPSADRAERVCDAFAAALLMPKTLLRRDWANGIQAVAELARRYAVSRPAMEYRLKGLGLLPPTSRCAVTLNERRAS